MTIMNKNLFCGYGWEQTKLKKFGFGGTKLNIKPCMNEHQI